MAMTVLAGFFHYIRVGPNETTRVMRRGGEMARTAAVTTEKLP